jgi:hypothetical protein
MNANVSGQDYTPGSSYYKEGDNTPVSFKLDGRGSASPVPITEDGISSGFLALQSGGLGDPQPKNLLGLINAAQLKMSERLQASVTASGRLSKPR